MKILLRLKLVTFLVLEICAFLILGVECEDDDASNFNYGMELVLLITFGKSSFDGPAEDALDALSKPTMDFPSLIVQATIEMMNNYLEGNVKLNLQCKELNGENLNDEKKIHVIMQ
ncbi:hypothetical protein CQW23_08080 [Capsicum baccatum]|uniref:Uncharacterized protein n=1 Tax=Capsicum baccatum TaxID=33114 RepID=A0A2G2X800_CAPBA|nr:hypothetical protein CQW23_08080 [Capsicum baccatum]